MSSNRHYGKYRGKVIDNQDPLKLGRIRATVPSLFSSHISSWALPCTPYAGKGVGFFFIPPIGANVWIEFEQGNPDNPIWTGCFWERNETKISANTPDTKVIKTDKVTITINDKNDSITLETSAGQKIVL